MQRCRLEAISNRDGAAKTDWTALKATCKPNWSSRLFHDWHSAVNFDLSREATDLRGEVQRFLSRESPLSAARSVVAEHRTHNESIWKQVVAIGWLGVAVP